MIVIRLGTSDCVRYLSFMQCNLDIQVATGVVFMLSLFLSMYALHSVWVTSEAYSSPSIVLSAKGHDGGRIIFDDFREAYYWLRQNTPEVSCLLRDF